MTKKTELRTVTAAQMEHISKGELKPDGIPKGLHTIKGDNQLVEQVEGVDGGKTKPD